MQFCFCLLSTLRHAGIASEIDLSGKKVQQSLQMANQIQAEYCLIIGDNELIERKGVLKKMATRENIDVSIDHLALKLKELIHV
jgi:histidyl-tRNA synthetase